MAIRAKQQLAAWFAGLPQRRQDFLADVGIAVALSAVNAVSLLPYRTQLHPLWLALLLVILQGVPLAFRRARPVGAGLVIGVARVAYDRVGFGFAPFPLGPAIAVYTVVDRRGRVWRYVVAALIVAGISLSLTTRGHSEPYDAIFQGLIFLTAWMAGAASRAKRARLEAARDRADRAEAEIDRQAGLAAAAERAKIARELHDVVAHHVSLIAVQAEAASSVLPGDPVRAERSVAIIGDVARQALAELRRLLGVLRGPGEQALTAPAASLADLDGVLACVREAGLPVELAVEGTPYPLAAGVDLTAFRIVQEALTNTLRHSRASSAAVTLSYEPRYVTVRVTDPGPRLTGSPVPGPPSPDVPPGRPPAGGSRSGGLPAGGSPAGGSSSGGVPAGGSLAGGSRSDGLPPAGGSRSGGLPPGGSLAGGSRSGGVPAGGLAAGGFGLAGIAERVASCGGNLTVGPTEPGGFAVTARLPAQ